MLLLASLFACSDPHTSDTSPDANGVDHDGDRWLAGEDCDDDDAAVHPTASERCDGVDDDCDGDVDEDAVDAPTWYADADADGFGDAAAPTLACTAAEGTVADATDCDDAADDVYPLAEEVCDGVDQDCDGDVDDNPTDPYLWYVDADGDGFGVLPPAMEGCTAPEGYVRAGGDCDDTDADVAPFAEEICDGKVNDCDGAEGEAGVATFLAASGEVVDLSDTLKGAGDAAASYTFSEPGVLELCAGIWFTNLVFEADVSVFGQPGDGEVVIDGTALGTVLTVDAGVAVDVHDVTVRNGRASATLDGATVGGGLACIGDESAATTVALENVTLMANAAERGGGIAADSCNVTLTDANVNGNSAGYGGGIAFYGGALTILGGQVGNNHATTEGGGLFVTGGDVSLEKAVLSGNASDDYAGGVSLTDGATLACTGDEGTASRIVLNRAGSAAGLGIADGAAFTADHCDLGAKGTPDDNDPTDIVLGATGYTYAYGDDGSFSCSDRLCGVETPYTIAAAEDSSSLYGEAAGVVVLAESEGTIDSFSFWLSDASGTCSADMILLSGESTSPTGWRVEWSGSSAIPSATGDWVAAGPVGVPVEIGRYYTFVAASSCATATSWSSTPGSVAGDLGFGSTVGLWHDAGYDAANYTIASHVLGFTEGDARSYVTVNVSH